MNLEKLGVTGLWREAKASAVRAGARTGGLLVVLHGRGDSAEGLVDLHDVLAPPGVSSLFLNAPDLYYGGYSWYDLPPNQLPGIKRSRALLEQVFAGIARQGYAPENTVLFGFSQGCLMTLEFGARYPHRLAGYVGVSGYCYDEKQLIADAVPEIVKADWLITHGTTDDVLPVETSRGQMKALIAAGFTMDYREYAKGHTIDPRAELPYLREWIGRRFGS